MRGHEWEELFTDVFRFQILLYSRKISFDGGGWKKKNHADRSISSGQNGELSSWPCIREVRDFDSDRKRDGWTVSYYLRHVLSRGETIFPRRRNLYLKNHKHSGPKKCRDNTYHVFSEDDDDSREGFSVASKRRTTAPREVLNSRREPKRIRTRRGRRSRGQVQGKPSLGPLQSDRTRKEDGRFYCLNWKINKVNLSPRSRLEFIHSLRRRVRSLSDLAEKFSL